jgi:hypothetical protein
MSNFNPKNFFNDFVDTHDEGVGNFPFHDGKYIPRFWVDNRWLTLRDNFDEIVALFNSDESTTLDNYNPSTKSWSGNFTSFHDALIEDRFEGIDEERDDVTDDIWEYVISMHNPTNPLSKKVFIAFRGSYSSAWDEGELKSCSVVVPYTYTETRYCHPSVLSDKPQD